MGHQHHHHADVEGGDGRVAIAVVINLGLTVAQIVGGILSGSLALIADALHNLSDAVSLIIAFDARRIARRPADADMTFGYARAEIVAALTYAMSKSSVNIRAAFLHNLADALGSIAVIVAGVAILIWDWRLVDPLVTLGIAGYILSMCFSEIGGVVRILMLGSDPEIDAAEVIGRLGRIEGVDEVHHMHLWQMDEHRSSADLNVVVTAGAWSRADSIKDSVKAALDDLGIGHRTIERECAQHVCDDTQPIGH